METQTSQFDYLFLLNIPIPIQTSGGMMLNVKTPSIEDYYKTESARLLEHVFLMSLDTVQEDPLTYGFEADTYLDIILGMKMTDEENHLFTYFEEITGTVITKQDITRNGVPLREDDILEIRAAFLISTGKFHIDGTAKKGVAKEDELSKKMRESQEKIDALRNKLPEEGEEISFKQLIIFIMYELNRTAEEIRNMNFYGLYELQKIAEQAPYDTIQKIAAGNGNLAKGQGYKNILSK